MQHTIYVFVCHPSVAWDEYGFCRPSLEREVQRDVRIHSSSCGTHRAVVHSPFDVVPSFHCSCRDHVRFVGRLPWLCGPNVLRWCLRRDVVWWWLFHSYGTYDSVWDSVGLMTGNTRSIISSTMRGRWVCLHAEWLDQQQRRICPDNYNYWVALPMKAKYTIYFFRYQEDLGCVCMLQ